MKRRLTRRVAVLVPVTMALVAGTVVGAVSMLAVQDLPAETGDGPTTSTGKGPLPTLPVTKPHEGVLLAWTPTSLAPGLDDAARSAGGVAATTVVRQGIVDMSASTDADGAVVDDSSEGFTIPVDAIGIDPATYVDFVPSSARTMVGQLGPEEVLLGRTSAQLRRLGVDATLTFSSGTTFRVAGIVDDTLVAAAEVIFSTAGADRVGLTMERYLLATFVDGRQAVEGAIRAALPPGTPVRLRTQAETPYLRAGDAVLPQVLVKQRFGEFAYRRGEGDEFEQDPAWEAVNIVTAEVPILGTIRCHRALVPTVTALLQQLEQQQLGFLIDPEGYRGCWNPRFTRTGTSVSRHAWGVALDVNYAVNQTCLSSEQDPRLVALFERWGFTWGGDWLCPDPAHVEYFRPPPS
ncbi:MAG: M15 family metallopeptidase [Acidimicrobiales bacterium]